MADRLEILPVHGIGDVTPGTDLAEAIVAAAPWLAGGDVLVVTSKIVSKSEGQLVDVPESGPEREAARESVLRAQTARPVARRGGTRIVQTHQGFVMASAGIDASNVDRSQLVLLPKDPDASARALRQALLETYGLDVAVIVSDTMGRPWRNGLTDVALGAAGIDPIRDHRGEIDPYGNELHITQMAVVDELSGAAELVKGKCAQVPVAVVRGYLPARPARRDGPGAAALVRDPSLDLFSMGTAEARVAGLRDAAALGDAASFVDSPVDTERVRRAIAGLGRVSATFTVVPARSRGEPAHAAHVVECEPTGSLVDFGADLHRLRCALAADDLAAITLPPDPDDPPDHLSLAVGVQQP